MPAPTIRGIYVFVDALPKTIAFYELLGFALERVSADLARTQAADGLLLEFGTAALTTSYDPAWVRPGSRAKATIALELGSRAEVDAMFARVVAAGHSGHLAPCDPPWGSRFAIVEDPDGNFIGLHSTRDLHADRARESVYGGKDRMAHDIESTADREFVTSRVIDAPRPRVFRAFSDPSRLAHWWGPAGFTNTFEAFDLRPGGLWRFVMHGPDGTNHPNESVFVDVVEPEYVIFDHVSGHHFRMTITFTADGEKTLVGWRQVFDTAEERERIAAFVIPANEQNLDRLAEVVRTAP